MIELSLRELLVSVVGMSMAVVVIFSWISRTRHQKAERKALQRKAVCRLCLAVFESDVRFSEVRCPECGASTGPEGPTPLG